MNGRLILFLGLIALALGEVFPNLPQEQGTFKSKVCVFVDSDSLQNETGIVYLNLAQTLQKAGHQVTLLTSEIVPLVGRLVGLSSIGISIKSVPPLEVKHDMTPSHSWESYELYEYLKTQQFDIVHIPDWKGYGYYSVLAKHQGIAFEHTLFVIGLQHPFIWSKLNNLERVKDTTALEIDFMQKKTVEFADVVVSSSQFILNWAVENGWTLPYRTYVQPSIVYPTLPPRERVSVVPDELVFFGKLTPCQGLILFCDGLDLFANRVKDLPNGFKVTFLGSSGSVQGISSEEYIQIRAKRWSFPVSVVTNKVDGAELRYLVGNKVAVISPEHASSPVRIQELLIANIPFIASNVGGISELVSEQSQEEVLFIPRSDKLAKKMMEVVSSGIKPAVAADILNKNMDMWMNWYGTLRYNYIAAKEEETPLVSVVITHYNRPEYLRQAIASIEAQEYTNIEVVLVDDKSDSIEAINEIENLRSVFESRKWKIIVLEENSYLGKARNIGVKEASGKYVLFLDDDNVAKTVEVQTFVKAAERTNADLLTSAQDFFSGKEPPTEYTVPMYRRVPLGGDLATGFFWNCFGDANSLVKRESFLSVGGFTEDYQVGYEDYEFFAYAILKGLKLEVVPEPLFWYRRSGVSMSTNTPLFKNRMRSLRPYMNLLPASLSNLFLLAQSSRYENEEPFMGTVEAGTCTAKNCSDCVKLVGCGWCPGSGECLPGTKEGPSVPSNCTMGSRGWKYGSNATCLDCGKMVDCESCESMKDCGWCDKEEICREGNGKGPYYIKSECTNDEEWYFGSTECPSSSSNKKKLGIIIGCSVAGGLLLLAALATGAFFIWQRQNRRKGYEPINQVG